MKQSFLPLAFGIVALAVVSIAWTFPISSVPAQAPAPAVNPTGFAGEIVRIGDGWIIASPGEIATVVAADTSALPR